MLKVMFTSAVLDAEGVSENNEENKLVLKFSYSG